VTLRIRAKDDWQSEMMNVINIHLVWGKGYFRLLAFNRTVSCPTLLIYLFS
jgi:hypothetical protein